MKLMTAQARPDRMAGHRLTECGQTIAKMHAPLFKRGYKAEKPCHLVPLAPGVDQPCAHGHIAATLAMDRAGFGKVLQSASEGGGIGESRTMKFRISTRKPAAVRPIVGCLISERREGHDLCPGVTPAIQQVRIDERKGGVARQSDPLAGRCHRMRWGRAMLRIQQWLEGRRCRDARR